ncbi:sigma-70 family RNA polymerase sigma factor [Clostridium neuense]|uniref:RNA polymerase sigma factor n=1 Tax=Clostridium neuense TaxID=1728934 RepID=A0ABW8TL36_9CLOT
MEEKEFVRMAQNGSKNALNILFQQNYKTLYGFLIKLTGDANFSEDLVQETLMKAMIHIKSFKGESKFSSWIIQIALNLYRNELKRNKKFEVINIDENFNLKSKDDIENTLQVKLQVERALLELQNMSYEKRVTFILKHYYGYSLEEISSIMKCSDGTVKSRLHNTVKRLKNILKA